MGPEHRSGLTALSTRGSGALTKPTAKASSGTLMVMSTKVFGKTIKQTGTESTFMLTVPSTKATGSTIFRTAKALSLGVMAVSTMEAIKKA